ncbi:hypothetical protein SP21_17 [Salmonella phage 21]|nr:hypothetical protein SP21_17 [Salmonella phage 21]
MNVTDVDTEGKAQLTKPQHSPFFQEPMSGTDHSGTTC